MPHTWDPDRYLTYADERGRPFVELLARVEADAPATVLDLGCGPGNLTTLLRRRWPGARVRGLDSSPEMIDRARAVDPAVEFEGADPARAAADYARLTEEFKHADAAVANASLDDTFTHERTGEVMSLRMIYLHLIEEYARHLGHADLLREQIDGVTGE